MPETDVTLAGEAMGVARRFVEAPRSKAQLTGGDGVTSTSPESTRSEFPGTSD